MVRVSQGIPAGQEPRRNLSLRLAGAAGPGRRVAAGQERRLPPSSSLLVPAQPATTLAAPDGLVTSATTARDLDWAVPDDLSGSIRELWRPAFPDAGPVGEAAGKFTPLPEWAGEEGPRWRITVAPGALAIGTHDRAKAERAYERQLRARTHFTDLLAQYELEGTDPPDGPGRTIRSWSRRSRSRMCRRLAELDFSPLLEDPSAIPAYIALTYPGDWLEVAPDGQAVKKHLRAFLERWFRAWGGRLAGVWKLEFQRRGAPHIHIFTMVPARLTEDGQSFRQWLSSSWAAVVAHPDPEEFRRHLAAGTRVDYNEGLRSRDPRRIAVYFSKHGTYGAKAYQNEVPDEWQEPGHGPGRFWGYWAIDRCAVVVEIDPEAALAAARVMRRWARAQDIIREVRVRRDRHGVADPAGGEVVGLAGALLLADHRVRKRTVHRRVTRMAYSRGWISLNDAPAFAVQLAKYLSDGEAL